MFLKLFVVILSLIKNFKIFVLVKTNNWFRRHPIPVSSLPDTLSKHSVRNTTDVAVKHNWLSCLKIGSPGKAGKGQISISSDIKIISILNLAHFHSLVKANQEWERLFILPTPIGKNISPGKHTWLPRSFSSIMFNVLSEKWLQHFLGSIAIYSTFLRLAILGTSH